MKDIKICVRRQWNDCNVGTVSLKNLSKLHWTRISGGVHALAPREFVHGYISCDMIEDGEISHSCRHGKGPHYIKVCITKKYNERVFRFVLDRIEQGSAD